MLFSILIAHYNNWHYFQECYTSILNQTYQDYEIIIVDDFTTDDSYDKLVNLSKGNNKIKLFRNSENKKVGYTKRRCVEVATGEICAFLDPDDMISKTALAQIIDVYKSNSNCIATYSRIKLIDQNSKEIGNFMLTKDIRNKSNLFFNINLEVAHFFSFKKEFYDKTEGINPTISSAVDQDLYMKLFEKGDFSFINSFQYIYRLHEKGVSQDKSKKVKLNENWHKVLLETCKRRDIKKLYGKKVDQIENLPKFIFEKENTFFKKLKRKFS